MTTTATAMTCRCQHLVDSVQRVAFALVGRAAIDPARALLPNAICERFERFVSGAHPQRQEGRRSHDHVCALAASVGAILVHQWCKRRADAKALFRVLAIDVFEH